MLNRDQPLALFMEESLGEPHGKMGHGLLRYSPNPIACVIDSTKVGQDVQSLTGIPAHPPVVANVKEALQLGARAMVLGIAPPGGLIPGEWWPAIEEAVAGGLSIVNGLHDLVGPRFPQLKPGQWIWDVRVEPPGLSVGTGAAAKLANKRVLMIGTDMAIGKMTAGLELQAAARARGLRAEFVATGQIGITIAGQGVPLDAVRVDFASGAIEREVLRHADADLIIVEGQGALIHPASTANLPLLRGSCPTHLILCHRAGQRTLKRLPDIGIPPLSAYARLYEDLAEACGTFPRPQTAAVALNTSHLSEAEAAAAITQTAAEIRLPTTDPVRHSATLLLDSLS